MSKLKKMKEDYIQYKKDLYIKYNFDFQKLIKEQNNKCFVSILILDMIVFFVSVILMFFGIEFSGYIFLISGIVILPIICVLGEYNPQEKKHSKIVLELFEFIKNNFNNDDFLDLLSNEDLDKVLEENSNNMELNYCYSDSKPCFKMFFDKYDKYIIDIKEKIYEFFNIESNYSNDYLKEKIDNLLYESLKSYIIKEKFTDTKYYFSYYRTLKYNGKIKYFLEYYHVEFNEYYDLSKKIFNELYINFDDQQLDGYAHLFKLSGLKVDVSDIVNCLQFNHNVKKYINDFLSFTSDLSNEEKNIIFVIINYELYKNVVDEFEKILLIE